MAPHRGTVAYTSLEDAPHYRTLLNTLSNGEAIDRRPDRPSQPESDASPNLTSVSRWCIVSVNVPRRLGSNLDWRGLLVL